MNTGNEPQWAPGAADYLASILTGKEIGWEWGGGASSVWLAPKVQHLTVIEHVEKWADFVIQRTETQKCTVHLHNHMTPHYLDVVELAKPQPNLWLIDGMNRIDCLELVLRKMTAYGDILVLDDALDYAEHLLELELDFSGGSFDRFAMPHPHAGIPCVSRQSKIDRNTVRTHAPKTKETWIWQV